MRTKKKKKKKKKKKRRSMLVLCVSWRPAPAIDLLANDTLVFLFVCLLLTLKASNAV